MINGDLSRRVAGVAAAAFALAGVAGFLPHSNWWWGFNTLRFYPSPARLAWLAATFAALGAAWGLGGRRALAEAEAADPAPDAPAIGADESATAAAVGGGPPMPNPGAGSRRGLPPLVLAGLAAIAGGTLFHLARARQFLAGDGYALLERLGRHQPPATRSPGYDRLEPAALALLEQLRGPGLSLTRAGFLNTLIGALLVGLVALILLRRARRGHASSSAALAALLLTQPALQLYCGYASPHGLLVAALTTLFLLLIDRQDSPGRAMGAAWPIVAAGVTLLEMAGLVLRPQGAAWRAPLAPIAWSNALNQLWLLGAPALVLLTALATFPRGRRALGGPAAWAPVAVVLLFGAARLILITPLGAVRDWEMFAALGAGVTGWAGAALAGVGLDEADEAHRRAGGSGLLAITLAVVGVGFTAPWIGLQADAARGVDRHLSVADGTPRLPPDVQARYHEAMGGRLMGLGQTYLAAQAYRRAFRAQPGFDDAWRSGLAYMACGRVEDAGGAFTECLRRRPDDWLVMTELGNALTAMNQFARADSLLRHAISLNPEAAEPRIHLARSLALNGREGDARAMLESARSRLAQGSRLRLDFRKLDENLPKETARQP